MELIGIKLSAKWFETTGVHDFTHWEWFNLGSYKMLQCCKISSREVSSFTFKFNERLNGWICSTSPIKDWVCKVVKYGVQTFGQPWLGYWSDCKWHKKNSWNSLYAYPTMFLKTVSSICSPRDLLSLSAIRYCWNINFQ